MHSMFGEWYRHAAIEVKSEELAIRWKGVENVVKTADKSTVAELTRCFLELPNRDGSFVDTFRKSFFEIDGTFRMQSNEVEVRILCGATLVALIQNAHNPKLADVAAAVVVAAVAPNFRKPSLIPDIASICEHHLFESSAKVRTMESLSEIAQPQLNELIEPVKAACATNTTAAMSAPLEAALKAVNTSLRKLALQTAANLALLQSACDAQAEESNMIWWIFGQRSRNRGNLFSEESSAFAPILAAKELSDLTLLQPPPRAAVAYLDKILESHREAKHTLLEIANALPADWLTSLIKKDDGYISLFPILQLATSIRDGRPPRETVRDIQRLYNLALPAVGICRISIQFYRELLGSEMLAA